MEGGKEEKKGITAVMMMMEAVSAEQKGEATLQSALTIPFWRGGFPGSRLRPGGGFHQTLGRTNC